MPAESDINPNDAIGIIAGGGSLPKILADHLNDIKRRFEIAGIRGFADDNFVNENNGEVFKIAKAGHILDFFRKKQVKNIVFIGSVKKPDFKSLIPDKEGAFLLNRLLKLKKTGDSNVFEEVIKFLDERDFRLTGIDNIFSDILAVKGSITAKYPSKNQLNDIQHGFEVAKQIGGLDIGQAVAVHNGVIISVEGIEGTDEMIERSEKLQFQSGGAILVKAKKPNQDPRIDLPTIGLKTVEKCFYAGFSGIAVEAGNSLIVEKDKVVEKANQAGIFIYGV